MALLPQPSTSDDYWRDVHAQALPFWQPAIDQIAATHQLPHETWARVPLGRNIVFCSPTTIIKLGPPCWPGEMAREVAALHFVANKLPVATPTVLASGSLEGWDYVVQARLPGTPLWQLWPQLSPAIRADLAYQHGQLMAAIHSLPVRNVPAELQFDWQVMVAGQPDLCVAEMRAASVDPLLVAQIAPYLAATAWAFDNVPHVLLHGDLNHLNFLVAAREDSWQLTGLIDWGDVKIGPRSHEFISPGVHMYKGDATALARWYAGYGLADDQRTEPYQHLVMTRAMLYYSDIFQKLIRNVEGAAACQDWEAMAQCFWHMA